MRNTIETATEIVNEDSIVPLTDAAINEAATIAKDVIKLFKAEASATENRAKLTRDVYEYIKTHGLANVQAHAQSHDFSTTSTNNIYEVAVQFVLGINIFHETTKQEKAERRNRVRPFLKCVEYLFRTSNDHDHLSFAKWFEWYKDQGQQSGMEAKLNALLNPASKPEPVQPQAEIIIENVFESPSAFKVKGGIKDLKLVAGKTMLMMVRQDDDGLTIVKLPNAGPSKLAEASAYRDVGLENAAPRLLFWHQLVTVAPAIVPDIEKSGEPVKPLALDDVVNTSTEMLSAYAVYLLNGKTFSVASSRMEDTRILEVVPRDGVDTGANSNLLRFMDKKTRNTMIERFVQPETCAGYSGEDAITAISNDNRIRIKFKHTDSKNNGQLAFPKIDEFGNNWTHMVSEAFKPIADATMNQSDIDWFEDEFLPVLQRHRKKDADVTVEISEDGLCLKHGTGESKTFGCERNGIAGVRVKASDLLAVMPTLLSLNREGDVIWKLDPEGLLMIGVQTVAATFNVYIQTLEKRRNTRCRKLLQKVMAPPKAEEPEADSELLAA